MNDLIKRFVLAFLMCLGSGTALAQQSEDKTWSVADVQANPGDWRKVDPEGPHSVVHHQG